MDIHDQSTEEIKKENRKRYLKIIQDREKEARKKTQEILNNLASQQTNSQLRDITEEFKALDSISKRSPHEYWHNKKVWPIGNIRYQDHKIYIPIYSPQAKDQIVSWQTIDAEGEKRFRGPDMTGKSFPLGKAFYFPLGEDTERIYVCEGVATGLSIHHITQHQVYCAFGRGNLDNLCLHLLKTKPHRQIVMCLDNDSLKSGTHKTNVAHNRFHVLCPELPGDFNDHQDSEVEQYKLTTLDPKPPYFNTLKQVTIRPLQYLDTAKMLLRGHLMTLAGSKGSLKSRGVLSYLLNEGLKVLYFSDNENTQATIKKIARSIGKEDQVVWWDFSRQNEKPFWPKTEEYIQKNKIDIVMEDPPFETMDFTQIPGVRKVLGLRARLATLFHRKEQVHSLLLKLFVHKRVKLQF